MSNVTENQKYLQSVHDELKAKLISIFRNENIAVSISVYELDHSDLAKFEKSDKISLHGTFNSATILNSKFVLFTK